MPAPQIIQSKGQWRLMLDDARRRTDEMLAFDPDRDMLKIIRAQLDFMDRCTKGGRTPTEEEAERITLGAIAVRNLEEEDPEYADWLKELAYAFRKTWKTLP
ncbi:MAG: hypothetical protein GX607_12915 [Myxococcales bacterium]|jgi:hypothetical protein|nr:hypothetical protein [Myxococcales bacterium]